MLQLAGMTAKILGRPPAPVGLFLLLLAAEAAAQGVSVAPNRILLDGRTRAATVFLSNRGQEAETYRISLVFYQMRENGSLVRADSSTTDWQDFAGDVLRYSPRRVVVPAGGSQTVRILVRRPTDLDLDDCELRAHLSVCSVPTVPRLREVEGRLPDDLREDQFVVRPVASIETLVPIIVRFGRPGAELAITRASLEQPADGSPGIVRFDLERRGQRSVYGDLAVVHVDPGGRETEIYLGRGIAIYTPNPRRTFELKAPGPDCDLSSGRVIVDYRETQAGGGDLQVQAEILPSQLSRR